MHGAAVHVEGQKDLAIVRKGQGIAEENVFRAFLSGFLLLTGLTASYNMFQCFGV